MYSILALAIPAAANIGLLLTLREHRTDLKPGDSLFEGEFRVWQRNVLTPRHYDRRGRALLAAYWVVLVVQACGIWWVVQSAVP